jgi:translation initiation factor IF-3
VRLIGPEGEQIGILPVKEALARARELGYDLVEVSPNSRPPVCRILDYGKYKYEMSKKDRAAKKKQHAFQLKEMRYRPKIDEHDFQFKTKHVREFLESGAKVKVFVMFRGRERAHTEFGREILDRVAEVTNDIAQVEMEPKMEGRTMNMVLGPRNEVLKKLRAEQQAKEVAEKKEKEAEAAAKAEKDSDEPSEKPVEVDAESAAKEE